MALHELVLRIKYTEKGEWKESEELAEKQEKGEENEKTQTLLMSLHILMESSLIIQLPAAKAQIFFKRTAAICQNRFCQSGRSIGTKTAFYF